MDHAPSHSSPVALPDDLCLALQRQLENECAYRAALSDILGIISRSPGNAQPIFEAIARHSVQLCGALCCLVGRYDGGKIHIAAEHNNTGRSLDVVRRMYPMPPSLKQVSGRVILTSDDAHVSDVAADPDYAGTIADAGGWRSIYGVPMQRNGIAIGVITVMRAEPGPFPASQIALLKSFADQAVIAIENARLFEAERERTKELQESLARIMHQA